MFKAQYESARWRSAEVSVTSERAINSKATALVTSRDQRQTTKKYLSAVLEGAIRGDQHEFTCAISYVLDELDLLEKKELSVDDTRRRLLQASRRASQRAFIEGFLDPVEQSDQLSTAFAPVVPHGSPD